MQNISQGKKVEFVNQDIDISLVDEKAMLQLLKHLPAAQQKEELRETAAEKGEIHKWEA